MQRQARIGDLPAPASDDGNPTSLPWSWLLLLGLAAWAWLLALSSLLRLAWSAL